MSLNLQERQAAALQAMLALVPQRASSAFTQTDAALPQASTAWKILIFDSAAKDILAPLMTVGMLRRQGVTLHLPLKSRRSPVVEAPAVYLVSPTEENVQLLLEELHQKLYAFYFFNFTDRLPEDLMQLLARGAVEAGMVSQVVSVVDRYVDYVCLSPSEFSLNKPGIYSVLNGNSSDAQASGRGLKAFSAKQRKAKPSRSRRERREGRRKEGEREEKDNTQRRSRGKHREGRNEKTNRDITERVERGLLTGVSPCFDLVESPSPTSETCFFHCCRSRKR
ncbi:Sec1 family protein [Toxoplasma gondii ARI]|uniref:Sec1 family protein n=1 Tax=Toxoplasma gondii ARI TaxID=1074872 RepID=A0A139XXX7_TOXGO|nr:Sec1 family protein [Toxoplasma gondii ARI]